MQSQYDVLAVRLRSKPILVVDSSRSGNAKLVSPDEAKRLLDSKEIGITACVMMNLYGALVNFGKLVGDEDREFNLPELAKISNQPFRTLHTWTTMEILIPDGSKSTKKERQFSWTQAFVAGLAGSLRRQLVPLPTIAEVARLVTNSRRLVEVN